MKTVIITKEYLEKIKGLTAIKPEEVFEFTPPAYRELPVELHPVFKLQTISGLDINAAEDALRGSVRYTSSGTDIVFQKGAHVKRILLSGLLGWNNYYTARGEVIEYDDKALPEINIGKLPPELMTELANEILSRTKLTEEERRG